MTPSPKQAQRPLACFRASNRRETALGGTLAAGHDNPCAPSPWECKSGDLDKERSVTFIYSWPRNGLQPPDGPSHQKPILGRTALPKSDTGGAAMMYRRVHNRCTKSERMYFLRPTEVGNRSSVLQGIVGSSKIGGCPTYDLNADALRFVRICTRRHHRFATADVERCLVQRGARQQQTRQLVYRALPGLRGFGHVSTTSTKRDPHQERVQRSDEESHQATAVRRGAPVPRGWWCSWFWFMVSVPIRRDSEAMTSCLRKNHHGSDGVGMRSISTWRMTSEDVVRLR